jgi:hypothetical protein
VPFDLAGVVLKLKSMSIMISIDPGPCNSKRSNEFVAFHESTSEWEDLYEALGIK